ncbi:hypothetical protein DFQ29_008587 [Apophysomyces sp. BC1021]|nr:hypothetical protein DFQ29_008587 [Apophysomyces sp. BC1021]
MTRSSTRESRFYEDSLLDNFTDEATDVSSSTFDSVPDLPLLPVPILLPRWAEENLCVDMLSLYESVHTVPRAKVPIVKCVDPLLQLACDMNVNNTLAIYNTQMIKTYIAIDPRVRPLAMIIKHWTKQRALNNAADGGTLSTYTWTCMIINFLQMREPPILPVLHRIKHVKSDDMVDGCDPSFYSDVESLRYFGERNRESLGGLLYAFFRRFAYEFDYETQVISVRHGRYLYKSEKGWDRGPDRRLLCVEEPFNVDRNLGNSADDTSVQGLRREFRRAVHLLWETSDLSSVCLPYVAPTFKDRPQPPPSPPPLQTQNHATSMWPSYQHCPPQQSLPPYNFVQPQTFSMSGQWQPTAEPPLHDNGRVSVVRRSRNTDNHHRRLLYANPPTMQQKKPGRNKHCAIELNTIYTDRRARKQDYRPRNTIYPQSQYV